MLRSDMQERSFQIRRGLALHLFASARSFATTQCVERRNCLAARALAAHHLVVSELAMEAALAQSAEWEVMAMRMRSICIGRPTFCQGDYEVLRNVLLRCSGMQSALSFLCDELPRQCVHGSHGRTEVGGGRMNVFIDLVRDALFELGDAARDALLAGVPGSSASASAAAAAYAKAAAAFEAQLEIARRRVFYSGDVETDFESSRLVTDPTTTAIFTFLFHFKEGCLAACSVGHAPTSPKPTSGSSVCNISKFLQMKFRLDLWRLLAALKLSSAATFSSILFRFFLDQSGTGATAAFAVIFVGAGHARVSGAFHTAIERVLGIVTGVSVHYPCVAALCRGCIRCFHRCVGVCSMFRLGA